MQHFKFAIKTLKNSTSLAIAEMAALSCRNPFACFYGVAVCAVWWV